MSKALSPRRTPARTLSAHGWRLVFAYEHELQKTLRDRDDLMARHLRALAAYFRWLIARDVDLPHVLPEDLHAYRLEDQDGSAQARARRFQMVRRFYRFLYCRGLLRHDPGALFDTSMPRGTRGKQRERLR